jgi:hypothetical protein
MIVITRSVWLITKLIPRIGSLKALLRQRLGSAPSGAPSATRPTAFPVHPARSRSPSRAPPEHDRERRRAALLVLDTRRRTGERRAGRGTTGGRSRERRFEECWRRRRSKRNFSPKRSPPHEAHLHYTQLAAETTHDGGVAGRAAHPLRWVLCYPVEHFLARTGGSNGRWDGRKLQRTQDTRDHRSPTGGGQAPPDEVVS